MHDNGIEPMVSLHHFSNPRWLSEKNDFHTRVVVDYFQRYTAKVVDELGDLIPRWITINEPLVYVYQRYINGKFPSPARTGWKAALQATRNLLRCHAAAYQTIKAKLPSATVGVAKQMAIFQPRNPHNVLDRWWTGRIRWLFNEMWMECMENGRFSSPLGRGKVDGLADSFDFIGLNYDTRFYVRFPPRGQLLESEWGEAAIMSDHNFGELYPTGLFELVARLMKYDKPIFVTSNGLPDADDSSRPTFILTHLREVWRAISFCFPVMGYYHHSLTDAAEWQHNWSHRFGLIAVDRETDDRHPRPSAAMYSEICQNGRIDSEITAVYAPDLLPILFPSPQLKKLI
jgi:beta-glucosidase